jgi:hypothetical protein
MQYLPSWTREGITGRLVVVRSRHRDTLTLIHYRNPPGDLRRLNEPIHDHGNPLVIVYCNDLPGTTVVFMRSGWRWFVCNHHIWASRIHMYERKTRTTLILIISMLVVEPKLPENALALCSFISHLHHVVLYLISYFSLFAITQTLVPLSLEIKGSFTKFFCNFS